MKDLTIIIPLAEYNEDVEKYLDSAVNSCDEQAEKIFIGPKDIKEKVEKYGWKYVINEDCDFPKQVNIAAKECKTTYFSILEFDDTYSKKWFENVEKYISCNDEEYKDVAIYMPLTEAIDHKEEDKGPIGYINEAVWASSFSDRIGFLDIACLKDYMSFNVTGSIIKKDDFLKVGGLKDCIKLVYWYEFLLRMIYNKKDVFIVPKVGYRHLVNRPGSISDNCNASITNEEADWWIELAQKDYLFTKIRDKEYYEYEK